MFPVIFVPFWGVLCVLLLHFQICGGAGNVRQAGVEKLKVKEELYKNILYYRIPGNRLCRWRMRCF